MRRIARPVSAWRINLYDHQSVGWKCRRYGLANLPRRIATSTQTAGDIGGSNQGGLQPGLRGYSAFCDFTDCLGGERDLMSRREVNRERQAVKHILALSDRLWAISKIGATRASEQHESSFLMFGAGPVDVARLQSPDEKTHPFPSRIGTGKMEKFTGPG